MDDLAVRIAEAPETSAQGEWLRHAQLRHASEALEGHTRGGRWSTKGGFASLYLGRPEDSVVVEAYRHLVDPVVFDADTDREAFMRGLVPRAVVSCAVNVTRLLDLRTPLGRAQAGLTPQDLICPTNDTSGYARCQSVAQVAHQLRRHGIIAPAATGLGETLVLFMDLLPASERPLRVRDKTWTQWPVDPRTEIPRLRIVRDGP
jgi:RES domain-containing protein